MQKNKDIQFLKVLGKTIKEVRLSKNLSQLDLAVLMDNYAEQISRIERGISNISICTFIEICNSLDMLPSELMEIVYKKLNEK